MACFSSIGFSNFSLRPVAVLQGNQESVVDRVIAAIVQLVESIAKKILHFSYHAGFNVLKPEMNAERERHLRQAHGAIALKCKNREGKTIEVRYIKSGSRGTMHVMGKIRSKS